MDEYVTEPVKTGEARSIYLLPAGAEGEHGRFVAALVVECGRTLDDVHTPADAAVWLAGMAKDPETVVSVYDRQTGQHTQMPLGEALERLRGAVAEEPRHTCPACASGRALHCARCGSGNLTVTRVYGKDVEVVDGEEGADGSLYGLEEFDRTVCKDCGHEA